MPHAQMLKPSTLALLAILSFGCNKNHDETRSNSTSAADVEIAEFPTLDAKSWVNGAPVSLVDARSKNVVLIEAWHPT